MTLIATSSQLSFVASRSFLLRPGVSNECLPIVYLPLRRRVVRSPEKGRAGQPTSRAGLTAHRRGSHAHTPPPVVGRDCEPEITLAGCVERNVWCKFAASLVEVAHEGKPAQCYLQLHSTPLISLPGTLSRRTKMLVVLHNCRRML